MSQDPSDPEEFGTASKKIPNVESIDGLKLVSETKLIPRRYALDCNHLLCELLITGLFSDGAAKKGYLMILTDAGRNLWEKRWFVLRRYACEQSFIRAVLLTTAS